ncbi:3125_t:CDS:2 [Paraglomus brasilianum]|uniref:3125_t:CDS:1 n=1 Tax=Paraglomus brasilianum TaxID=144538 RepID=A0A9N8VMN7_9GLOM|nr:3125_t:CDS:2 [Paraglomus brasilianum]
MENSALQIIRPLSDLEKAYVISHNMDYFTNICTTVRYQCKNLFPSTSMKTLVELKANIKKRLLPVIYRVLAEFIPGEPALSIGIKNSKAPQPCFVHIPTIDLSQQIRFIIILSDEDLERILEIEHEKPFDLSSETAPLWRMTVAVHSKRNDELSILFCCHHCLMDIPSFLTINTLFYNALKKVMHDLSIDNASGSNNTRNPVAHGNIDYNLLGNVSSTVNVPYAQIFEPWDKIIDVTPSIKLLVTESLKTLHSSLTKSRSKYYAGDFYATNINIKDFRVKLKIMSLDPDEFKSLLLISKQQNSTIHAIIHTALLISARHSLVDLDRDKKLSTLTPISIRPYAYPPINNTAVGLYVTTYNFMIPVTSLKLGFWDITKTYESELAKNLQRTIQRTGLQRCAYSYKNQVKVNSMRREASLLVSNADVWMPFERNKPVDEKVKILEMLTSQSTAAIGPVVTVNIATYDNILKCTFVHQEGAIRPKKKLIEFIHGFKKILAVVSKKGDWNDIVNY